MKKIQHVVLGLILYSFFFNVVCTTDAEFNHDHHDLFVPTDNSEATTTDVPVTISSNVFKQNIKNTDSIEEIDKDTIDREKNSNKSKRQSSIDPMDFKTRDNNNCHCQESTCKKQCYQIDPSSITWLNNVNVDYASKDSIIPPKYNFGQDYEQNFALVPSTYNTIDHKHGAGLENENVLKKYRLMPLVLSNTPDYQNNNDKNTLEIKKQKYYVDDSNGRVAMLRDINNLDECVYVNGKLLCSDNNRKREYLIPYNLRRDTSFESSESSSESSQTSNAKSSSKILNEITNVQQPSSNVNNGNQGISKTTFQKIDEKNFEESQKSNEKMEKLDKKVIYNDNGANSGIYSLQQIEQDGKLSSSSNKNQHAESINVVSSGNTIATPPVQPIVYYIPTMMNSENNLNEDILQNAVKKVINNFVPGKSEDLLSNYGYGKIPILNLKTDNLSTEILSASPILKNLLSLPEVKRMIVDTVKKLFIQINDNPNNQLTDESIEIMLDRVIAQITSLQPNLQTTTTTTANMFVDLNPIKNDNWLITVSPPTQIFGSPVDEISQEIRRIVDRSALDRRAVIQPVAQNFIVHTVKNILDRKHGVIDEFAIRQILKQFLREKRSIELQRKVSPPQALTQRRYHRDQGLQESISSVKDNSSIEHEKTNVDVINNLERLSTTEESMKNTDDDYNSRVDDIWSNFGYVAPTRSSITKDRLDLMRDFEDGERKNYQIDKRNDANHEDVLSLDSDDRVTTTTEAAELDTEETTTEEKTRTRRSLMEKRLREKKGSLIEKKNKISKIVVPARKKNEIKFTKKEFTDEDKDYFMPLTKNRDNNQESSFNNRNNDVTNGLRYRYQRYAFEDYDIFKKTNIIKNIILWLKNLLTNWRNHR